MDDDMIIYKKNIKRIYVASKGDDSLNINGMHPMVKKTCIEIQTKGLNIDKNVKLEFKLSELKKKVQDTLINCENQDAVFNLNPTTLLKVIKIFINKNTIENEKM